MGCRIADLAAAAMRIFCACDAFALTGADFAAGARFFDPFAGILAYLASVAATRGFVCTHVALRLKNTVIAFAFVGKSVSARRAVVQSRRTLVRAHVKSFHAFQARCARRHDEFALGAALGFRRAGAIGRIGRGVAFYTSSLKANVCRAGTCLMCFYITPGLCRVLQTLDILICTGCITDDLKIIGIAL